MTDATDDHTTTPTGDAPKLIIRAVSKAPPPITPLRGSNYFHRRKLSDCDIPVPLPGFVAFRHIRDKLAANAEAWGIPQPRLPAMDALTAFARPIEEALANNMRAAGIVPHNGNVVWAPAATWRIFYYNRHKRITATEAAINGEIIDFPAKHGQFPCDPILSCRDLALIFGADIPPEASPQSVMDGIGDIDPPRPDLAGSPPNRVTATNGDKTDPAPAPSRSRQSKPSGGRKPKYDWPPVEKKIHEWLKFEGVPIIGDGEQAKLEAHVASLFHVDCCPAETTIRDVVRKAIAAHAFEQGQGR